MSQRPNGAAVLVTGGARGIGAASVRALADDGWGVAVLHRNGGDAAAELAASIVFAGGRAIAVQADLREPEAVERAFGEAEEALGPVLGLVNNAGVRADNLALSISDEDWDLVVDTNLGAAFRLTRRAVRGMLRARFGRIVNVASVVGPRANPGQANYAASKAGLIGLTKTVAAEVARKGVTVNAVAPGFIATDMTADVPAEVVEAVPARRAGQPEEVAACVRFLASDAAAYVTGTTLYVDGGMAA
jgi:3-oxoacyl-[acyl-carrier protein] reductase